MRYAHFGKAEPSFRSKEFAKLLRDAGLETPAFSTRPPNRVDIVFAHACVHGPGGFANNRAMSLDAPDASKESKESPGDASSVTDAETNARPNRTSAQRTERFFFARTTVASRSRAGTLTRD